MKKSIIILAILSIPFRLFAQSQAEFKAELKKLSDDLAQQISVKGNKRVAVANFLDLQGNATELGRYLAQQFSVNLVRSGLDVIDRSRLDELMNENNMSAKGLLDPQNQAKLGKLAGIEVIITGTTSPFDRSVELTASAIDVIRGSVFAATDGSITRTEAINILLRSQFGANTNISSVSSTPFIPDKPKPGQDPSEVLMGDSNLDLPKSQCEKDGYIYGQVYFENTLKEDLVLYNTTGSRGSYDSSIKIAAGTRNKSPLFIISNNSMDASVENTFYFHTAEEDIYKWRYGQMKVTVNACKLKVHVINPNRIFFTKTKP